MSREGSVRRKGNDKLSPAQLARETGISAGLETLRGAQLLANGTIEFTASIASGVQFLTLGGGGKTTTGFVTFRAIVPAHICHAMTVSPRPLSIEASIAPDARDIVWRNMPKSRTQAAVRGAASSALVAMLAVFWTVAIQLCFTLTSLTTLKRLGWDSVEDLAPGSIEYQLLTSLLPVLLLNGLLVLLPFALQALSIYYEDVKTYSEVQSRVLSRYFTIQMVNLYLLITNGTLTAALKEILRHPERILELLGDSLPLVAVYFTSIIIVKLFVTLPYELSRLLPLVTSGFMRVFRRERLTARDWSSDVYSAPQLRYGWAYPSFMLVIVVCNIYAPIAPIICPFGFAYFFAAQLTYKHQCLHVYVPVAEAGGELWFLVIRRTLFGIACGNTTLAGMLLFKENYWVAIAAMPAIGLPLVVGFACSIVYENQCQNLSLERAITIDAARAAALATAAAADGAPDASAPAEEEDDEADTAALGAPRAAAAAPAAIRMDEAATFNADYYRQPELKVNDLSAEAYRLDEVDLGYDHASDDEDHVISTYVHGDDDDDDDADRSPSPRVEAPATAPVGASVTTPLLG